MAANEDEVTTMFAYSRKSLVLGLSVAMLGAAGSGIALAKKGGNAGSGNGGEPEPVYIASGALIIADDSSGTILSTNLSFNDIIFRPEAGFDFDLSGFPVHDPDSNGSCPRFSRTTTGTLVLTTGDSAIPDSAELRFGFQGLLSGNGKSVQYFLVMKGFMYYDGNSTTPVEWPPVRDVTFELQSWSISAENKRAQKSDCEGSSYDSPNEPALPLMAGIGPASP